MHPEQVLGQVECNHPCRAAHASQGVALRPGAHLEVVHHQGTQAGGGVEEAAVGDHKVDLAGLDTGLVKQGLRSSETGAAELSA